MLYGLREFEKLSNNKKRNEMPLPKHDPTKQHASCLTASYMVSEFPSPKLGEAPSSHEIFKVVFEFYHRLRKLGFNPEVDESLPELMVDFRHAPTRRAAIYLADGFPPVLDTVFVQAQEGSVYNLRFRPTAAGVRLLCTPSEQKFIALRDKLVALPAEFSREVGSDFFDYGAACESLWNGKPPFSLVESNYENNTCYLTPGAHAFIALVACWRSEFNAKPGRPPKQKPRQGEFAKVEKDEESKKPWTEPVPPQESPKTTTQQSEPGRIPDSLAQEMASAVSGMDAARLALAATMRSAKQQVEEHPFASEAAAFKKPVKPWFSDEDMRRAEQKKAEDMYKALPSGSPLNPTRLEGEPTPIPTTPSLLSKIRTVAAQRAEGSPERVVADAAYEVLSAIAAGPSIAE